MRHDTPAHAPDSPPFTHTPAPRVAQVILCPGLGSSGAYCFDLAPAVSLADFLAERGWDVWTVELRGALCAGVGFGRRWRRGWPARQRAAAHGRPRSVLCTRAGNGQSDKPSLLGGRSRWWTIDDHVEKVGGQRSRIDINRKQDTLNCTQSCTAACYL